MVIKYSFALYYYYYYFKLKQNLETKVYVGWPSMISRDWCFTLGNVYSLRVAEWSSFMVVFFVLALHFVWILIIANHWGSYFVWRLDCFLFGKVTISSSIMIECWKMVLLVSASLLIRQWNHGWRATDYQAWSDIAEWK